MRSKLAAAILTVPVVLVAFIGFSGRAAQAAVPCVVPTVLHPTIQSAVNDPTCDPINVLASATPYNENVQITRPLTLNGAQANIDARTRSGPESIIDNSTGPIQILANNVTVNGFTLQGAVDNPNSPPFTGLGAGIWTNPGFSGTDGGHQILNNIIQNNISGIELDNTGAIQTKVQFNLFRNNNKPGAGSGNGIEVNFGLRNALIDNNTFTGDTSSSFVVATSPPNDSITFSNNLLLGGSTEGIVWFNVSSSSIVSNTSIGSTSGATVYLGGGDSTISVNNNILANGMRGIQVENPFSVGANSMVTAHGNCISGNSAAGLEEDMGGYSSPPRLNATNNWWGSTTGPTIASNSGGTGDRIIDADGVVDYNPFTSTQPPPPCPVSFTKLASGSFVIGDRNASVGSAVTFWGAQWSKANAPSGGAAPSAFKGFADTTTANPPACNANWSTAPGNSSQPPASVPQTMAVIVSSSIGKSGSSISGDTVHVVVVQTNPGYAPNPGHAGTGTVVAVLC